MVFLVVAVPLPVREVPVTTSETLVGYWHCQLGDYAVWEYDLKSDGVLWGRAPGTEKWTWTGRWSYGKGQLILREWQIDHKETQQTILVDLYGQRCCCLPDARPPYAWERPSDPPLVSFQRAWKMRRLK